MPEFDSKLESYKWGQTPFVSLLVCARLAGVFIGDGVFLFDGV